MIDSIQRITQITTITTITTNTLRNCYSSVPIWDQVFHSPNNSSIQTTPLTQRNNTSHENDTTRMEMFRSNRYQSDDNEEELSSSSSSNESSQDEQHDCGDEQFMKLKKCVQNGINPNIYFNTFRGYSFLRDTIKLSRVPTRASRICESISRICGEKEYTPTHCPPPPPPCDERIKELLKIPSDISLAPFATVPDVPLLKKEQQQEEDLKKTYNNNNNNNETSLQTIIHEFIKKISQESIKTTTTTIIIVNPVYSLSTPMYEIPNVAECYVCGRSSLSKGCGGGGGGGAFTKISRCEKFSFVCGELCHWADGFFRKLLDEKSVPDVVDTVHEVAVHRICSTEGASCYFGNLSLRNVSRLMVYRHMFIFGDSRMDKVRLDELRFMENVRMMTRDNRQYSTTTSSSPPLSGYEFHYLQVAKSVLAKTKTGIIELPETNVILIIPELQTNGKYHHTTQDDIMTKGVVKSRIPSQTRSQFPPGTKLWKLRERSMKKQGGSNHKSSGTSLSTDFSLLPTGKRKRLCKKQQQQPVF